MKCFYNRGNTNFGDYLNSWLWERLCPELIDDDASVRLIGVGTLLAHDLDLVPGEKVIFGTGAGYGPPPAPSQAAAWDIRALRGPLTAKTIGAEESLAITDSAWLVARLPEYSTIPTRKSGVSFVPHWRTCERASWDEVCEIAGMDFVNPLDSCEKVFRQIGSSELAIVESLHGAIMADFFRTPWIPVITNRKILRFKWLDWCASLGLEYTPYQLPPSSAVDYLIQGQSPIRKEKDIATPRAMAADEIEPEVWETSGPPTRAGIAYHGRAKIKKAAQKTRRGALFALRRSRFPLIASWDEAHASKLAQLLQTLSKEKPHLSDDSLRDEKIDRLNQAFENMRQDYARNG